MDKALSMGKTSAIGSFQLLIGVVLSTVILAIGTIVLARIMPSASDYGLFAASLIPSSIINFFRDLGINSAMTKQIANLRTEDKKAEIHDIVVSGVIFEIISGATLALICYLVSGFLAEALNTPNAKIYISIMSLSVFGGSIISAASAIFIGYEKMKFNSLTTVLQSLVRTSIGPLLVIMGYGVFGAIVGVATSYIAGGIVGLAIAYFAIFRRLRKCKTGKCDVMKVIRPMLKFGVPLMVSNFVAGVLPLLLNSLIVIYAGTGQFGNYTVALNFAVLLTFITFPITTVLFPAFSKLNPEKDSVLLQPIFASSIKYTALFLVPATLVIMVLSAPMVNTLFGYLPSGLPKYSFAPIFLSLYVANYLFVLIGNFSINGFLAGLGKSEILMKQAFITLIIGLPLAFILVRSFGVVGGIIGYVSSSVPGMIWVLHLIWKRYKARADFRLSAKILFASLIAAAVGYLSSTILAVDWFRLVIGSAVFLLTYMVSAPLIGAIKQDDIVNLRMMFSGVPFVSRLIDIPLKFMEKPLKIRG